jgi:type I restriction enzyme M protein
MIHRLITRVQALSEKYAVTYSQLTTEIEQTENALADLLGELEGNAFDMQGLSEFQSLLKGL